MMVMFGVHNLTQFTPGVQISSVSKINIHPDWNPEVMEMRQFDADIAVLLLDNPALLSSYVQPICLAAPDLQPEIADFEIGIVAGFGKSEKNKHEDVAKVLELPIERDTLKCVLNYPDLFRIVSERTFCAGKGDRTGVCNGDSGSGLLVKHQGAYFLRGIVSSSAYDFSETCDVNQYAVFTDVLKYTDWINSVGSKDQFLAESNQQFYDY